MNKFLNIITFFLFLLFGLCVNAEIIHNSASIKYYGIGVLNMPQSYKVYSSPDKDSGVIRDVNRNKAKKKSAIVNMNHVQKISYIAFVPSNNVALLPVETDNTDGWYNVYLNQKTGETGWVYVDKADAFYTYKSLFYAYGKRYGVKFFNDLPEDKKILYSQESTDSKILQRLNHPKYMTFTVIRGNWMLVTVSDKSKQAVIGWYQWRNDDGTLNMLPNFKEQYRI